MLKIICLCAISLSVIAKPRDELTNLLDSFQTLQASFKQTTYDSDQNIVQNTSGSLILVKPNKFKWNCTGDNNFLLIVDGEKILNYDVDLEQVTITKIKKLEMQKFTPLKVLLMGTKSLQEFNVSKNKDQCFVLQKTKNADDYVEKIKLCFKNGKINILSFYDYLGQNTIITFTNIQLDQHIKDDMFIFKAPKNVDIIKEEE